MTSTWMDSCNTNRIRLKNPSDISDGNVHSTPWHFFYCLGSNEYVQTESSSLVNDEPGYVILFNHKFDKDSGLFTNNKLLFRMAHQCILLIDSGYKVGLETRATTATNCESLPDANYLLKLRKQISEFLAYVCNVIQRLAVAGSNGSNDMCSKGNIFALTSENMIFLQLLLSRLHKGSNRSSAHNSMHSYHLLHTCLDIYCYHLDFLLGSIERQKAVGCLNTPMSHSLYDIDKHTNLLVSELLMIAVVRFHEMLKSDLTKQSPFSCSCMEQIWVMLITVLDKLHERDSQNKPFWASLNVFLEKVTSASDSHPNRNLLSENFAIPAYFICKQPEMFKLWLVSHLSRLYQHYRIPMKENFVLVEAVMKQLLIPDTSVPEDSLQAIILLVAPLVCNVWSSKSEVVMILWEYFHRRLNSILFQHGTSVTSLKIIQKTSRGLVKECQERIVETFNDGDSWGLFLHLLGRYLKKSQQKHWNQVRGRIYSKFSATKLQSLTELGLYRFSSLFLTLSLSVDMQETSTKLVDLISLMNVTDLLRSQVLWRTQFALIILYIEHGLDITSISQPLMQQLTNVDSKDVSSASLMKTVVEELQTLVEYESFLKLSGHTFVNTWMSKYLLSCSDTDACQLYGVLLTLTLKLQHVCKTNSPTTPHVTTLAESLWQHILPSLLMSTSHKPTDRCDSESFLGFQLTLLSLYLPRSTRSFSSLFCRFVNSSNINVKVLSKYVCLMIADSSAKVAVEKMDNYQGLIIRAWLRCLMLSVDGKSADMCTFTKIVSKLPEIEELSTNQTVNLNEECDTLAGFLTLLANSSTKCTDRISFYLNQIETYLTRTNISSQRLALHLYNCAAAFVQYAPNIIYSKTPSQVKSSNLLNSIISHLLLPASLYNPDTKLKPLEKLAITDTLHIFIRALVRLKPQTDPYISKCAKDLIVQYLPRLCQDHTNTVQNFLLSDTILHPLLKCFDDLQSFENGTGKFVLDVLSSTFIACKGKTKNKNTTTALAIVKTLLQKWNGIDEVMKVVTNSVMGSLLEVIMFTEESANTIHQKAREILLMLVNKTGETQGSQTSILINIVKDHLAFSAVYVFRLLETLVKLDPQLVQDSLTRIKDLITIVEQKRGLSYDAGLRNGVTKIELMLKQRSMYGK